jgi:hypothetical protein
VQPVDFESPAKGVRHPRAALQTNFNYLDKEKYMETWSDVLRRIARELEEIGPSSVSCDALKTIQVMNDLTSIANGIGNLCLSKSAQRQGGNNPPECDRVV